MPSSSREVALAKPAGPAVRTAAGLGALTMVAASLVRFGPTPRGLVAAFFASVLVVLSSIDIEHGILPNRIVLPSAALLKVTCYTGATPFERFTIDLSTRAHIVATVDRIRPQAVLDLPQPFDNGS